MVDQFIKAIRRELKRQDITQAALARRCGISRSYLHRVLTGKQVPTLKWSAQVAEYLGLSLRINGRKR